MFEQFTDRARRVVVLAQEEARLLDHNYIGTEHILLGLIHEGEGVAATALRALGISLDKVRRQVEEIVGAGQSPPTGHIPFTPRAKKVLELSLREALQLGNNYIGTEHILLGLLREGEGVAAQALVKLGANLTTARQKVLEVLSRAVEDEVEDIIGSRNLFLVEPRTADVAARVAAARPLCPFCGASLQGHLAARRLEATEPESDAVHETIVFHCSTCGVALGTGPAAI